MKKKSLLRPLLDVLLILVLGVLAYSNTLQVPFVFDDEFSIVDNPEIQDLSRFVEDALSGNPFHPSRYVGFLTLALNYRFGGLDVTGYHVVNIAIHLVNALLVYALFLLTFRAPTLRTSILQGAARNAALLAGTLFVVHPIQTQAVTYVVQRLASLAVTFYLSTFVLYALARLEGGEDRIFSTRGWGYYLASLSTAVLAMRTKEISFTLPILLSLYEFFFFDGAFRRRFLALAPHLLTLIIIPMGMLHLERPAGDIIGELRQATEYMPTASRYEYLITQFPVIVTYLRLLVLPIGQNLDYDYPIYNSFFKPPVFLSFLLLAALFLLAIHLYRIGPKVPAGDSRSRIGNHSSRNADSAFRLVSFGILWFFVALSVESSFIPIADVIFEHRAYLPSAGAFTAAAAAFAYLAGRGTRKGWALSLVVLAAVAVLVLAVGTWKRNEVWRSPVSLWRDVAEKSPNKARAYINLGASLGEAGRFEEAIPALARANRLQPGNMETWVNLGAALASSGRREEAIRILSEAARVERHDVDVLNNLGIVLTDAGRPEEAITVLADAVKSRPGNARAHFNLGRAYLQAGRPAEAIGALQTALRLKPDYDQACVALAAALNSAGRFREAAALLGRNMGRLAGRADARFASGVAAHCMGNNETARRELDALRLLDPAGARQLEAFLSRPCGDRRARETR